MNYLAEFGQVWLVVHLFAMVLGLGGATYTDILLVRFLKDLKISHKEAGIIRQMSHVILIGIFLAFVSGFFLYIPKSEALLSTPKFLVKLIIFTVLSLNGCLLHSFILPKLVKFSFHKDHFITQTVHLRHLGFVMGAISFVSWYSVFLLGALKEIEWSFGELLMGYLFILGVAVCLSLVLEYFLSKTFRD